MGVLARPLVSLHGFAGASGTCLAAYLQPSAHPPLKSARWEDINIATKAGKKNKKKPLHQTIPKKITRTAPPKSDKYSPFAGRSAASAVRRRFADTVV